MSKETIPAQPNKEEVIASLIETGLGPVPAEDLYRLSQPDSSRHGTTMFVTDAVREFAKKHNLDIKDIPVWSPDHSPRVAVAKKEKVAEALPSAAEEVDIPELAEKIAAIYQKIKDLPVVDAVEFLEFYPRMEEKGNLEQPEVAVFDGLLFGYKPCDIEYYIKTRYFNEPEHDLEDAPVVREVQHAICKDCAQELLQ